MPATGALAKKAVRIDEILTSLYGRQEAEAGGDPLDTLVETILSQNTTDANSHRSYLALKKKYPRWERMLGEDPDKIARIIRSGGLAPMKARRILAALDFIRDTRGELDLGFLSRMSPADAEAWLGQMKGVGPKTRSIVLLFSLGMPAFPVDTHIHRVTRRLGLIGEKTSREGAQTELVKLVPKAEFYNFHINLIEHGRAVCRARNPQCEKCEISRLCKYYRNRRRA
jgi:endonuclease-3